MLVEGKDVVTPLAQAPTDRSARDVGIKQKAQGEVASGRGPRNLDKRVFAPQFIEGTPLETESRVDLIWEFVVVGEGKSEVARLDLERVERGPLVPPHVLPGEDDLPHVEVGADDPGSSPPLIAPERQSRIPPGALRLVSKLLDEPAFGHTGALMHPVETVIETLGGPEADRLALHGIQSTTTA